VCTHRQRPAGRVFALWKRGKISTHLCIRKAREEQTPTKTYWNPGKAQELPGSVYRVWASGVWESGFRLSAFGFRRQASGCRASGVGRRRPVPDNAAQTNQTESCSNRKGEKLPRKERRGRKAEAERRKETNLTRDAPFYLPAES
jgi:hypothetical protein